MPTCSKSAWYTQDSGTVEVPVSNPHQSNTQIHINVEAGVTTGTLNVFYRGHENHTSREPLLNDEGLPTTIDLSNPTGLQWFQKWMFSVIFEPVGVVGSYEPIVLSGNMFNTRDA